MPDKERFPDRIQIDERVTIRRRGKKRIWTAEFHHTGDHCRKSLKTANLKIARRRAARVARELELGEYRPTPAPMRIAEAVCLYMEVLETDGRAAKTITRYAGELKAFSSFAASRRVHILTGVSPRLFDAYRAHRSTDHKPASVCHESVVTKGFLKWCVTRGFLHENPLALYKIAKPPREQRPAPTLAQVNAILQECSPRLRDPVALLAFTGVRVGELQGFRKIDIDFQEGFINVVRQIHGPTKTRTARRIPIHRRLLPMLRRQLTADQHELLFTAQPSSKYPAGGHHVNVKRLNDDFKSAAKRIGIRGFTLHSLRRSFNTRTINARVPERIVRRWMGHADRSMTGLYYDLNDQESRRFMDSVSFEGESAPETTAASQPEPRGDMT